jgi:hypothetical protein
MMSMRTIAWDIDDVLNDLMREWFDQVWRPARADCPVRAYEGIVQNPPHELLGVTLEEYQDSLDEFRLSGGYSGLEPSAEVRQWFMDHGHRFRHVAVSAVPVKAASVSAEWVMRHFGRWIRTFHFVPSARSAEKIPLYDQSKRDFLEWLGKVDILIDDNETNLWGCDRIGIKTILFPRPWNSSASTVERELQRLSELAP